ncbi:MAG: hypothetical protein ABWX67_14020 [Allosphingosinicella sp.]
MHLVEWLSNSWVINILGIAGAGSLLDALLRDDIKNRLARYIFVPAGTSRDEIDCLLITGLIEAFSTRRNIGRLSHVRVLLYSIWSTLLLHLLIITSRPLSELRDDIAWWLLPELIAGPLLAYPFDLWSIWVSKRLFYYQALAPHRLFARLVADLLLSSAPVIALTLTAFALLPEDLRGKTIVGPLDPGFIVILGGMISLFGTLCFNALQLLAMAVANSIRAISRLFPRLASPIDPAKLYALPFTVCFLLLALVLELLQPLIITALQL